MTKEVLRGARSEKFTRRSKRRAHEIAHTVSACEKLTSGAVFFLEGNNESRASGEAKCKTLEDTILALLYVLCLIMFWIMANQILPVSLASCSS